MPRNFRPAPFELLGNHCRWTIALPLSEPDGTFVPGASIGRLTSRLANQIDGNGRPESAAASANRLSH